MDYVWLIALIFILAKWIAELWLATINQRHVIANADRVPAPFKDFIDDSAYRKSVQYTLAKSRFGQIEDTAAVIILLAVLFSGILPAAFRMSAAWMGASAWSMAAFLFAIGVALSLPKLPFEWFAQFRLEERFGFNTTTQRLWWLDRLKGLLISLVLGYPLLALILKLVDWTGPMWWFWAWIAVMAFQLLLVALAPVIILPLFNKFTPLPEGSLQQRLLALSRRASFIARSIQVMDGSKRSRHSNAFFTGFGRSKKIVLFDTLLAQLTEPEIEAVLAHEIGHYKKRHVQKMLLMSCGSVFIALYLAAALAKCDWLYYAFGFQPGHIVPALLLFALLSGAVSFWLSPALNSLSRRHEFQADRYAAHTMNEPHSLIAALRKLDEKNLSNLTPHPIYSRFYYSHPTLLERQDALLKLGPTNF